MKYFLCLLAMTVALNSVTGLVVPHKNTTIHSATALLVETLTFGYVNRLVAELRTLDMPGEGLASLIPPIADPVLIAPVEIPIDIVLDIADPPVTIIGTASLTEETSVVGLSHLEDDFVLSLQAPPYKAAWDLTIPSIAVNGAHSLDLVLDLGSSHRMLGSGPLTASVNDVFVHILATLKVAGLMGVPSLELDFGFKGLALDGGDDVKLDDTVVNWETLSNNLQTWFDTFWGNNEEVKGLIREAVRCSADHVVNSCTLASLIGGTECLKLEIKPECLGIVPTAAPTTTTESASTDSSTSTLATTTPNAGMNVTSNLLVVLMSVIIFVCKA